jgi:hypothetical protein
MRYTVPAPNTRKSNDTADINILVLNVMVNASL